MYRSLHFNTYPTKEACNYSIQTTKTNQQLTNKPIHEAEDEAAEDEGAVPLVQFRVRDSRRPQEDEDDRLTDAAQHLHEVLDGRVRLARDVGLDVRLHEHRTGHDSMNR